MTEPITNPPDWLEEEGWLYVRVHYDLPKLVDVITAVTGESAYDAVTSAVVRAWGELREDAAGNA